MKKKTDDIFFGTYGRMKKIDDFLPAPHELVFKKPRSVKVTMEVDKYSVDFFKREAAKYGGSYQSMIRALLHQYVMRHQESTQ